jgi:YVTN family beta-propeller protein
MRTGRGRLWLWGTPCTLAIIAACSGGEEDPTTTGQPIPGAGAPVAGQVAGPGAAGAAAGAPVVPGAAGGTGGGAAGAAAPIGEAGASAQMPPIDGGGAATGMCMGAGSPMRDVLLVGNGVGGTVSFLDACTFESLGSVNIIPDMTEVMGLINSDPLRLIAYPVIKSNQLLHHFEPGGGDRFLDDVFVSPEGTTIYVSRSNLGDVAAFDLTKAGHPRLWRSFVSGLKADHATISPDGSKLIVSATTANSVDVIDAKTGQKTGSFPHGNFPHQNDYSADGKYIYNSSIGNVGSNVISYANNSQKGEKSLVKVDANTLQIVKTWTFEWGVRPNVITKDDKILYTQLSYLNGVIKYDLEASQEIARSDQPLSEFAMTTYKGYDEYPHDSAHHGLALSGDGTRLCDCGTIDNTVTIVSTDDMQVVNTIDVGNVPYWATTSPDGRYCYVSLSGSDAISVIDYQTATEVMTVPVGKFPQRSRLGKVPESVIAGLLPMGG